MFPFIISQGPWCLLYLWLRMRKSCPSRITTSNCDQEWCQSAALTTTLLSYYGTGQWTLISSGFSASSLSCTALYWQHYWITYCRKSTRYFFHPNYFDVIWKIIETKSSKLKFISYGCCCQLISHNCILFYDTLCPHSVRYSVLLTFYLTLCYSASSETAAVKWGVKSGVYDKTVPATTSQILRSSMCGKPANSTGWRDLGLTHTALLTGMSSLGGSPIYYIFGDTNTNNFSEEMVFNVPTPRGKELAHR